jgi:hypothetical protein
VLAEVVHVFTHRRLTTVVHRVDRVGVVADAQPDGSYEALAWIDVERPDVGLSRLADKVIGALRSPVLPFG